MRINSLEIRKLLIHEDSKLIEEFLEQWIPENEENSDIEVEDIIKNFFDYFQLVRINQDKINNNLIQLPISKIQESNN